jgi:flavodoxin
LHSKINEYYINIKFLLEVMKACVLYFSRTGNTKRLAHAIADMAKAPIYDLSAADPEASANFDLLILGTPVEGSRPTKEIMDHISKMPTAQDKKVILFTTYRLFGNERTMNAMEKELSAKGYKTILKVSKKGMKPEKEADFSKLLAEIQKVL